MRRNLLSPFLVALLLQTFCMNVPDAIANAESILVKRIGPCRIEEGGAYNALADISQKAHILVGVDAIQPEKEPTIVIDFPGGTVADLLNMFTSNAPDYQWQEDDHGRIHVFRNGMHVSLVDVVISYPGAVKKTRKEIWEDIARRPEVATWMEANRCSRGELFTGWEFRDHNDPISIESGSITVSQLLDDVADRSGVNYWAVLQSAPKSPCRLDIILW